MNIKEVLSYLVSERGREDLRVELRARLLKADLPSTIEQAKDDNLLNHIFNCDGQDVAVIGYIESEDRILVKYLRDYPCDDEYAKFDIDNMCLCEMIELVYSL